jgi:acetyl esterase/lipase
MFSYPTTFFDDPPQAGRAIDLWIPEHPTKSQALYFVHGGGWRMGHREQMHAIMYGFYQQGYPCVSVCYRLKDATIATQLEDVRLGLALADRKLSEKGFSGDWVVYGSSAGAHLALLAGLAAPGACGETVPESSPRIAGIIASSAPTHFEPWDNMFPEGWSCIERAVGIPYEDNPEIYKTLSPVTHATAQSPPLMFLLGECEHMFPNKHSMDLVERLSADGHSSRYFVYDQAEHGFFYALTRPAQKKAFQDVLTFLNELPVQAES